MSDQNRIQVDCAPTEVLELLASHPLVDPSDNVGVDIAFSANGRSYSIREGGDSTLLPEDVSPACSSDIVLADPTWVLPLLAIRPLIPVGIVLEPPVALTSFALADGFDDALHAMGWDFGLDELFESNEEHPQLAMMLFMAHIRNDVELAMVNSLYDAAYKGSRLVAVRHQQSFDFELVRGTHAVALAIHTEAGGDSALLAIRAWCSRAGKIGTAGLVQAMNRVARLDEATGLLGTIPLN